MLKADVERTALLQEEERLSSLIHSSGPVEEVPADLKGVNLEVALMECYERMDAISVSTAEVRAMKILSGLGFNDVSANTATALLSGGWTMRASLASALYTHPDLLLLDEVSVNNADIYCMRRYELHSALRFLLCMHVRTYYTLLN